MVFEYLKWTFLWPYLWSFRVKDFFCSKKSLHVCDKKQDSWIMKSWQLIVKLTVQQLTPGPGLKVRLVHFLVNQLFLMSKLRTSHEWLVFYSQSPAHSASFPWSIVVTANFMLCKCLANTCTWYHQTTSLDHLSNNIGIWVVIKGIKL